ncbi:MAG: GNAT family N-acetyltransferase [Terrimesophilobacter sp.]
MVAVAGMADVDRVVEIIARAFTTDPVWGVALARPDGSTDHCAAFWRPYVEGAMRHSSVYLAEGASAVAVWLPPGCDEMTESQEADVLSVVETSLPAASKPAMLELWDRFTAARPQEEPHAYLSLLATDPDHRGRGVGQQLLRENLQQFDAQHLPAYLESTNPANNHRYERAGFTHRGQFTSTFDSASIATLWRPVGGF